MPRNVTGSSSSSPGQRGEGAHGCHRHSKAPERWISPSGSLKQTRAVSSNDSVVSRWIFHPSASYFDHDFFHWLGKFPPSQGSCVLAKNPIQGSVCSILGHGEVREPAGAHKSEDGICFLTFPWFKTMSSLSHSLCPFCTSEWTKEVSGHPLPMPVPVAWLCLPLPQYLPTLPS